MSDAPNDNSRLDDRGTVLALAKIRDALTGLRYGEVIVKVQDGVVVQLERTERLRLQGR